MPARITQVRDAVVALINDDWTHSAPDEVAGVYEFDIDSATLAGRQVYVLPSTYSGSPATRADDENAYTVVILVAERYTDAGSAPVAWLDERVAWCEWLLNLVAAARGPRLLADEDEPDSGLWADTAEATTVYDVEELAERKLFLSVLTITFREQVAA